MTFSDILAMFGLGGGGGAQPAPAAGGGAAAPAQPAPTQGPTMGDQAAYMKYRIACQELGMQPRAYPDWVKAGRPPT